MSIYSRLVYPQRISHMPLGVNVTLKHQEQMHPHCRVLRPNVSIFIGLLRLCIFLDSVQTVSHFTAFQAMLFSVPKVSFPSTPSFILIPCVHIFTSDLFTTPFVLLSTSSRAKFLAAGHNDCKVCKRGELCHFSQHVFHFKPLTFQSRGVSTTFRRPLLPLCKMISFRICLLLQLASIV